MAVDPYQVRNSQNLQALINYMKERPNEASYEIGYSESQSGKIILLGKGYSDEDLNKTKDGYKGKLILQEESLGSILVTIKPEKEPKGGRLELQMYVRQEIEKLTSPYSGQKWRVRTQWV